MSAYHCHCGWKSSASYPGNLPEVRAHEAEHEAEDAEEALSDERQEAKGIRDALLAVAMMAVNDDGFCAHDVLETLDALGHKDLILEARELVRSSASEGPDAGDAPPDEK